MNLNPILLKDLTTAATALGAAFLVALWLSLIFWAYRDIRLRTRDPVLRVLAVLVVMVLFVPGILIYLILRPGSTQEEEYQRTLEEEALLQTIEEPQRCPGCGRVTQNDWMFCPNCHTKLKKVCHQCKKLLDLPWELCAYCGAIPPGARREDITQDDILSKLPGENSVSSSEPVHSQPRSE